MPNNEQDQFLERPMPSSKGSEDAVLGGIILNNSLISQAIELLTLDSFYFPVNRKIYMSMLNLFNSDSDIQPVLLIEEIRRLGHNEISSVDIANLTHGLPQLTSIANYAKILKDKSDKRKLIKLCNKVLSQALEDEDKSEDIVEVLGKGALDIAVKNAHQTTESIGKLVHSAIQRAYEAKVKGTAITGIATGLIDLDSLTLGLQNGGMYVIAARPSMGKSALAIQIGMHAAMMGKRVLMFSLEMSKEEVALRVIQNLAKLESRRLRSGHLTPEEMSGLEKLSKQIMETKFLVNDTPGISLFEIKAHLRRIGVDLKGLDLIIVDYIQLMSRDPNAKYESRQNEVAQISRELKSLAKEMNVPVIALSQLSRAPENRTDHRPQLADLRESGSIEQDADSVAFIYRKDMYLSPTDIGNKTNTAEIILAKQRNGPTGSLMVRFDEKSTRFSNYQKGNS